jgi:hypothetical protein
VGATKLETPSLRLAAHLVAVRALEKNNSKQFPFRRHADGKVGRKLQSTRRP